MNQAQPAQRPDLTQQLPHHTYYQLIHTLAAILPPPLADTPEALLARNHAALDAVADMLPVHANEAGFAAQCVAARAQAEDVLRLLRAHAGDIRLVIKLCAQYNAMVRASQGAHGHVLRAQAVRHKREQSNTMLDADAWTRHIAASSMQQALDAGLVPAAPAAAQSAPAPAAEPLPALAPEPASVGSPPAQVLAVEASLAPAVQPPLSVPAAAPPRPRQPRSRHHHGAARAPWPRPTNRRATWPPTPITTRPSTPIAPASSGSTAACRPIATSVLPMMTWCAPSAPAPARPCAHWTHQTHPCCDVCPSYRWSRAGCGSARVSPRSQRGGPRSATGAGVHAAVSAAPAA